VTIPGKRPSSSGSIGSTTNDSNAAIRAAYQASVRKKKSFHRNSWNASPSPVATSPPSSSKLAMSFQVGIVEPMSQIALGDAAAVNGDGEKGKLVTAKSDSVLVGGKPAMLTLDTDIGPPHRTS
jgi:hypothetical protein